MMNGSTITPEADKNTMSYNTLITTDEAYRHLNDPQWLFIDCRYYLEKPAQGQQEYSQSHITGALYADLAKNLSAPVVPGVTGRHPLPEVDVLCLLLSNWGVGEGIQVVVYDQGAGMIAARLWWMLRWLGHDNVAVIEGGWTKWLAEAKPVTRSVTRSSPRKFKPNVQNHFVASVEDVQASIGTTRIKLIDARSEDRYRGENETLDPVAGHIPGAVSAPFMENVGQDGCLRSREELLALYTSLLGDSNANDAIFYCGSGVTAALNILVVDHVGLGMPRLYPGSWSHWITDENRRIATGH
jgi:thiosulfate/3-mercaptopyruvate sulfurtransferase